MAKNQTSKGGENKGANKGEAPYEGKKEAPSMTVTQVQISQIDIVDGFNVRQTSADRPDGEGAKGDFPKSSSEKNPENGWDAKGTSLQTLANDMKEHGLLQPILVRPIGSRFGVVSGHRRLTAAKILGWKSIPCVIRPMSEQEAYEINLTENVQREDLSPGEIADRAVLMRDKFPEAYAAGEKGGGDALAKVLGVSKSYMNKLLRYATGLAPEIWSIVRSGKNRNAPPNHLLDKWQAMEDHEEQIAAYRAWRDGKAAPKKGATGEGGEGEGEGEGASDAPAEIVQEYKRPGKDSLLTLEETIRSFMRNNKDAGAQREYKGALAVVLYAIGKLDKDGKAPEAPYKAAKTSVESSKK